MRKLLLTLALAAAALLGHAQEVIVMDKAMFIDKVFDYENSKEWKYKGDKPAIIDLYADWCGPCRKVAPIMKELAKEYAGKITIYKVNVDKEQELEKLQSLLEQKGLFVGDLGEQRRRMQDLLGRMDADMRLLEEKGHNMVARLSEMRGTLSSSEHQRTRVAGELEDARRQLNALRAYLA